VDDGRREQRLSLPTHIVHRYGRRLRMTSSSKSRVVKYSHLGVEVRAGSRHSGPHPHVEAICGMPKAREHRCSFVRLSGFQSQDPWAREYAPRSCSITAGSLKRVMRSENERWVDSREVRRFGLTRVQHHTHGNKPLNTISHRLYISSHH
jgi:hypothetical protein